MRTFTGKGRGKVILLGEHAVVYGKPAIAAPLDLGVEVRLVEGTVGDRKPESLDETGVRAYRAAALDAGIDPGRFLVEVFSDLPVGLGLGSSAALSVAAARAILRAAGKHETDLEVIRTAQIMEAVFHGRPSGIDAAAALGKGPILFMKGRDPAPILVGVPIHLVVAVTGSSPSTKAMVDKVRRRYEKKRERVGALMDRIGDIVLSALDFMRAGDLESLGLAMNENHEILKSLGVSSPALEALRKNAIEAGAMGAKLTGGGGGGAVICLAGDRRHAGKIAKKLNLGENSFISTIKKKNARGET